MNSSQKLDLVLSIIVKTLPRYISINDIIKQLGSDYKDGFLFDLQMILDKLIEDKNVKTIELTPVNINTGQSEGLTVHYQPTFKGKFLSETGGYQGLDEQRLAENTRLRKLETSQQKLMGKLNVITAWVAGATIALVLVELWKMCLEHHWLCF